MTSERRRGWPLKITQPLLLMRASSKEGQVRLMASRCWSAAMLYSMTHQDCDSGHLREYLEKRFRHIIPDPEILESLAQRQIDQFYERGQLKTINLAIRTQNLLSKAGFFKSQYEDSEF